MNARRRQRQIAALERRQKELTRWKLMPEKMLPQVFFIEDVKYIITRKIKTAEQDIANLTKKLERWS